MRKKHEEKEDVFSRKTEKWKEKQYRYVYNNFQFYESDALVRFVEKQAENGLFLCGIIGIWGRILKLRSEDAGMRKRYNMYRKNLDDEIDRLIENEKWQNRKIACENRWLIFFEDSVSDKTKVTERNIQYKQNALLGIALRKTLVGVFLLLIVSIIALCAKRFGTDAQNEIEIMKWYICVILNAVFLLYFIADLHDIKEKRYILVKGKLNFSERSKLKTWMFRLCEICRVGLLGSCILETIFVLNNAKNLIVQLDVLKMWLLYGVVGYFYKWKLRHSYISLLVIAVLLEVLGFSWR